MAWFAVLCISFAKRSWSREINSQKVTNKAIAIFSDSQATFNALSSFQVFSRLVGIYLSALKEVSTQNRVTLAFVPGHEGHKGNEEADVLARKGASKAMIFPEPFCGVAKACINSWMLAESIYWWNKLPGMRQAKEFIKKPSPRFTEDLLNHNREAVRVLVGLLTEHSRVRKHMSNMGTTESAQCRLCQEEEETALQVLCECEAIARLRHASCGEEKPEAASYMKVSVSRLWSLIKEIKLDNEL
ncbi:uncharacterized protein [Leptinotarsa decemlineata]|uniref:uncharacterized protein n=1 Tax=Leptinotarsa decemlineata TaxID=7539 RepID=UPI003D30D699